MGSRNVFVASNALVWPFWLHESAVPVEEIPSLSGTRRLSSRRLEVLPDFGTDLLATMSLIGGVSGQNSRRETMGLLLWATRSRQDSALGGRNPRLTI